MHFSTFSIFIWLCRSPSERPGKDCCGQWFAGPPLRAVIAVVALGKCDFHIYKKNVFLTLSKERIKDYY